MVKKKHESLCTSEEMSMAYGKDNFYRIPADLRSINYDTHQKKNNIISSKGAYSSDNTKQLNVSEIIKLLKKEI